MNKASHHAVACLPRAKHQRIRYSRIACTLQADKPSHYERSLHIGVRNEGMKHEGFSQNGRPAVRALAPTFETLPYQRASIKLLTSCGPRSCICRQATSNRHKEVLTDRITVYRCRRMLLQFPGNIPCTRTTCSHDYIQFEGKLRSRFPETSDNSLTT